MNAPASIQASIIKEIGAEEKTVEVVTSGNVLIIARVNSNMNASTHAGRDNEANVIGSLVAKRIANVPKFKTVVTIRIQYIVDSSPTAKKEVVDSIRTFGRAKMACLIFIRREPIESHLTVSKVRLSGLGIQSEIEF